MKKTILFLLVVIFFSIYFSCSKEYSNNEDSSSIYGYWKQNENASYILEFNKDSTLTIYEVSYNNNYTIEQKHFFNIISENQIVINGKNIFYKIENGKLNIYDENQYKYFQYPFIRCEKPNVVTEKEIIQYFIQSQNIVVLDDYPVNRDFKSNEYYKTDKDLYIQVIDSGNGMRAYQLNEISIRFEYMIDINENVKGNKDTIKIDNYRFPYRFLYGLENTYKYSNTVCEGFSIPLDYVSEQAIVNLIIPSNLGTLDDRNNKIARFYKNLTYTRFN